MTEPYAKPRCDECPNFKALSGIDGECHASGPPWKPVAADDFCPKHPEWHGYLVEIGAVEPDEPQYHGSAIWDGPRD